MKSETVNKLRCLRDMVDYVIMRAHKEQCRAAADVAIDLNEALDYAAEVASAVDNLQTAPYVLLIDRRGEVVRILMSETIRNHEKFEREQREVGLWVRKVFYIATPEQSRAQDTLNGF